VSAAKKAGAPIRPRHFATAKAFGAWLDKHHTSAGELWVGFWKKGSGKPSIDWPQAVREALRVGWIDGIRKSLGDEAYVIRFLPRRAGSAWSAINIRIAEELIAQGCMTAAGLRAFGDHRTHPKSGYSIRVRSDALPPALEKQLRAHKAAWSFWQAQPPGYRRGAVHWVTSAKRDETQARRMAQLVDDSAAGRRLGALTSPTRRG
jgi:uncharacterized protein YdeI (YjbR/CyaY-like superfamily)